MFFLRPVDDPPLRFPRNQSPHDCGYDFYLEIFPDAIRCHIIFKGITTCPKLARTSSSHQLSRICDTVVYNNKKAFHANFSRVLYYPSVLNIYTSTSGRRSNGVDLCASLYSCGWFHLHVVRLSHNNALVNSEKSIV